jgi:hypothetical protein
LKVKNQTSPIKAYASTALSEYEKFVKSLNEAKTAEEKYKIKENISHLFVKTILQVHYANREQNRANRQKPSINPHFDQMLEKAIADHQNTVNTFKQAATPAEREQALDKGISILFAFLVYVRDLS